jgi:hypothetical protein
MKPAKKLLIPASLVFLFIFILEAAAQKTSTETILEEGSVQEQFNQIVDKSSTYNDYKAIKASNIYTLRKNVFDTLKTIKADAAQGRKIIAQNNQEIESLKDELNTTQEDLALAIKEKNSLQFLGIKMNKTLYNGIMWLLAAVLAFSMVIFILLYKRSHVVTAKALSDLEEIREEFEQHRKRALERQEEVVRRYHAELNKYKSKVVSDKS